VSRADRRQDILVDVLQVDVGLLIHHANRFAHVSRLNVAPRPQQAVELFENLAGKSHRSLVANHPHFVATRTHVDTEFLFDDSQGTVAGTVQRGRRVVIVEDESLSGAGVL
jgi:hypothetical protein